MINTIISHLIGLLFAYKYYNLESLIPECQWQLCIHWVCLMLRYFWLVISWESGRQLPIIFNNFNHGGIQTQFFFNSLSVFNISSYYSKSPFAPSYIIDLSKMEEKIHNIVDIQFLQGYYEPTLFILYEPIRTWAGWATSHSLTKNSGSRLIFLFEDNYQCKICRSASYLWFY